MKSLLPGRQVFLDSLKLHGVRRIFGNPGTTESPLLDSLHDRPEIEYVTVLQESIAVTAASHYAQAAGEVALVNLHVAPGLGNAIGAVYGALKAASPVVITAGQQDTRMRMRDPLLGHDLAAMAAPVVKWSTEVRQADEMAEVMRRAFKVAGEHPQGPVFVALPINVMEQTTARAALGPQPVSLARTADQPAMDRLVELVSGADRIGIVAGDDLVRDNAVGLLTEFAEMTGAGVHQELLSSLVSFNTGHPAWRGLLGPDHRSIQQALADYDLVLLLGGPFFEEVWFTEERSFAAGTRVVQLELSEGPLGRKLDLDLGISGSISVALAHLLSRLDSGRWVDARDAALRLCEQQRQRAESRLDSLWDRSPMTAARALKEVATALPDDVIVVDESITARTDVIASFRLAKPGDGYAGRGGGIGQGLAGALGVALAVPDRRVVAVSGDGSAMYSIQALWSAVHHALDIVFVILANREYRILKHNMDAYRTRFAVPAGNRSYPYMNLSHPSLSFVELAAGMGVPGRTASSPEELRTALAEVSGTSGPFLLELHIQGLETP